MIFGRRLTLFRLFGFGVRLDLSWLLIALLITWSLAEGFFPARYPGLDAWVYWTMGLLGALGLFASIVFHEFCHSLVARRYELPMEGITLFLLGGIAEMGKEPETPKAEFFMAVAGPVSSLVLAVVFYGLWLLGIDRGWSAPVNGISGYLAFINLLLALFNLLPAFPLDGGRILRSALWYWQGNLTRATRTATRIGSGFGIALILFGLVTAFGGHLIGGLWYILIGFFLRSAARMSFRQLLLRLALEGKTVASIMNRDSEAVWRGTTLDSLQEDYWTNREFHSVAVVDREGLLEGCISRSRIRSVIKEKMGDRQIGEFLEPCREDVMIDPGAELPQALSRLKQLKKSGIDRLWVVDSGKLVGTLTLRDIFNAPSVTEDWQKRAS